MNTEMKNQTIDYSALHINHCANNCLDFNYNNVVVTPHDTVVLTCDDLHIFIWCAKTQTLLNTINAVSMSKLTHALLPELSDSEFVSDLLDFLQCDYVDTENLTLDELNEYARDYSADCPH